MDSSAIKLLLDSQNQAFRSALDIVVEQFKARVSSLESRIQELTRSLEFTQAEVLDLKEDLKAVRKSNSDKETTVNDLKGCAKELVQRLNYQDDYSRRNNLRITGLYETAGESWEQTAALVSSLLQNKLELPPMDLERAHRVGTVGWPYSRTIIARFERFQDREAVMRNTRKLKGSGVFINEDLCPASQEVKRSQMPAFKQARSEGKIAFFKHTKLIIKDKRDRPWGEASVGGATSSGAADLTLGSNPARTTSRELSGAGGRGGGGSSPAAAAVDLTALAAVGLGAQPAGDMAPLPGATGEAGREGARAGTDKTRPAGVGASGVGKKASTPRDSTPHALQLQKNLRSKHKK